MVLKQRQGDIKSKENQKEGVVLEGILYEERGYLYSQYKLFHIADRAETNLEYHYHAFDKIILFLSGNVTYMIEGKAYQLAPGDILLVRHHDIHKPIITPDIPYERFVLWILPEFLERYRQEGVDLAECFLRTKESGNALVRVSLEEQAVLKRLLAEAEEMQKKEMFAGELYETTLILQFFIRLNHLVRSQPDKMEAAVSYNPRIIEILTYINANLEKNLSVEQLSERFYISRYHLMRVFKEETGYTLHNYIQKKRLFCAADLIREGMPATQACFECGFADYSTFQRAFKASFDCSPASMKKKA